MSFTKYLESKLRPQIIVIMDDYKEKLIADVSSLLLKPDSQLAEAHKHTIDIINLSRILSELNYPFANEFQMAIRTSDARKINHAHTKFRKWADYTNCDSILSDKIETIVFEYEAKLYKKEFDPHDVDKVVKSSLSESNFIIEQIVHYIDFAVSKISDWNNHKVVVEAVVPKDGWIVSEANVIIGENYQVSFICENTPIGFKIKELKQENNIPVSFKNNIENLILKLKDNPKYNGSMILYMMRPISERKYFESIKRDLSLGIKSIFPKHIILANAPLVGEFDIWKVRIEQKYVRKYLNEGDVIQYNLVSDEVPIKWIERVEK